MCSASIWMYWMPAAAMPRPVIVVVVSTPWRPVRSALSSTFRRSMSLWPEPWTKSSAPIPWRLPSKFRPPTPACVPTLTTSSSAPVVIVFVPYVIVGVKPSPATRVSPEIVRMSSSSLPLRPWIVVRPVCVLKTVKRSSPWPRTMFRSSAKPS